MDIWWRNQSRDWNLERPAKVVCTTDHMENLTYRKTVSKVRRNDIVVHYRRPFVVALSRALENAAYYEELLVLPLEHVRRELGIPPHTEPAGGTADWFNMKRYRRFLSGYGAMDKEKAKRIAAMNR